MRILTALSLAIPIALQVCILVLLIKRQLQRRFVWFFTYIAYAALEAILRLAFSANQRAYFTVYWLTAIVGVLLAVAALRESFLAIFWPETKQHWFKSIFWSCIALAAAYAAWKAWAYPPQHGGRLLGVILGLEFAVDTIISVVGLLYGGLIKLFSVREHQRESGIILGFTVNASISTFSWITLSVFGTRFELLSEWIPAVAYILAEVIWMRELFRPERLLPEPNISLEQMNHALDRYRAILQKYRGRQI